MEMGGQLHVPVTLPPEMKRNLGGHQKRDGSFGEEKSIFLLSGFKPCMFEPVA